MMLDSCAKWLISYWITHSYMWNIERALKHQLIDETQPLNYNHNQMNVRGESAGNLCWKLTA